jgi:hypothetical protein
MRRPSCLLEHEIPRVGGRVHALVRRLQKNARLGRQSFVSVTKPLTNLCVVFTNIIRGWHRVANVAPGLYKALQNSGKILGEEFRFVMYSDFKIIRNRRRLRWQKREALAG